MVTADKATVPGDVRSEIKGSVFRGCLQGLRNLRLHDDVRSRVSSSTRTLMDDPPLPSAWMASEPIMEIHEVVSQVAGLDMVRKLIRESSDATTRVVQPMIQGLMRLFGASPSTLLSRMTTLSSSMSRGTTFAYSETGPRTGRVLITFHAYREPKRSVLAAMEASLEILAEMCVRKATATLESSKSLDSGSIASFVVEW